jgi:hypothetical protein
MSDMDTARVLKCPCFLAAYALELRRSKIKHEGEASNSEEIKGMWRKL